MRIVVVGAGAAGHFAALSAATHHRDAEVVIHEKSNKLLAKVRISGGGRCNVTHDCLQVRKLASNYPRGERFLRKSFELFAVKDTVEWFARRGVVLKVEPDGRMFPVTDDSSTIIEALTGAADELGVQVSTGSGIERVVKDGKVFRLTTTTGRTLEADRIIVTTGGHPKRSGYGFMDPFGHTIVPPVPSLFTFNIPGDPIRELMGVVVPARVRIAGTDLESTGPVLITHWGFSGPAVLRASAWGARLLNEKDYAFTVQVNWLGGLSEDLVRRKFHTDSPVFGRKMAENTNPFQLPKRFWAYLLLKAGIPLTQVWDTVPKKERNRLIDLLTNDRYNVKGKTTFKDEFVTAGGVALDEVDPHTMESRKVKGLFFAGEVLDIDGITGGFNFQAAWTTGYLAGKLGVK
ncbi:MAG: NAD(P)/FAD-dependent oxidoreductase [Flavobacteriales bacterium]